MTDCRYCTAIHAHDPAYSIRPATHNCDTDYPRCDWHWRYVCDACGQPRHFNGVTWCPTCGRHTCVECSPHRRVDDAREAWAREAWGWGYYWAVQCPACGEYHPALDRLEYEGRHPWQVDPAAEAARRGLSAEVNRADNVPSTFIPLDQDDLTDADIDRVWSDMAAVWDARYTDEGDASRRLLLNEVMFRMVGDVAGQRILDAGCGAGYLSRLLAQRGAEMVGVDLSEGLLALARRYGGDPTYHHGSLSDLGFIPNASFDVIVSMVVLQDVRDYVGAVVELDRVLRPGGLVAFTITHPCFNGPPGYGWERHPFDSKRPEDHWYWRVDHYFQRAREDWDWLGHGVSYHRPLTDYMAPWLARGYVLVHFEEPEAPPDVLATYPSRDVYTRIPYFLALAWHKPPAAIAVAAGD
ncbi:MAG: class I SAM-dependent methyltransferase [Chloroflexi bacterium]|nr:class I SAM-dependent methyltransferase [Chloroflexota bacterium]MBU1749848.1 class I SAM-dependent methyltransferase [Chloroflexota bacterium]